MQRLPMTSYEAVRSSFRWELPSRFNFGADVVDDHARRTPDRTALIWCDAEGREERYSYEDIRRLSNRMGNLLRSLGIAKGDRVIVMLPRVPQWQIAMIGCLKIGAIPIPCIEMLTAKDIAYRLANCAAAGAITMARNVEKFAGTDGLRAKLAVGGAPGWSDLDAAVAAQSDELEPAVVGIADPAIIFYTSGSTGGPKGVTHAARALFTWRVSAWYWLTLTEQDVMWCTADTGWSKAGTSILFGPWSCGSTVLFYDGPFDARRRFEFIERYGVTVFCAAATELRRLLLEDIQGHDLSRLRLTVSAGELVNPEIVTQWKRLTGVDLLDGYGQTETLMTVLNYPPMPVRPGSMGRPLPGTEIGVLDEGMALLGPGEAGQLAIRLPNPQVMLEYWQDPDRTAATRVRVGEAEWFLTGDRVVVDEDGYVYHEGRVDDVINSAGYRIGPMEVENALAEHPAVAESAAVASPDPDRGEVVKAFVVLKPGAERGGDLIRHLQDHCKRITGPYKYPRRIAFVDELPKTPTGKIRRRLLRDREFQSVDAAAATDGPSRRGA